MSDKQRLFISYSHKDADWLDKVQTHLATLRGQGQVTTWSDKDIQPGDHWNDEIEAAMRESDVAVLLVSPNFLASDFIIEQELPRLLVLCKDEQTRLHRILPLILNPCRWQSIPALKELEVRPKGHELSAGNEHQQNADLMAFAQQISDLLFAAPAPVPIPIGLEPIIIKLGAKGYATLELRLSHCEWNSYRVELTFTWSGDRSGDFLRRYGASLDLNAFGRIDDAVTYARNLRNVLFPDQEDWDAVTLAKARAVGQGVDLCVRLCIEPSARELHSLNWEKLTVLDGPDNPLAVASTVLARYALGYGGGAPAALVRRRAEPTAILLGTAAGPAVDGDDGTALHSLDAVARLLGQKGIACTISKCWHEIADLTKVLREHDGSDYIYLLVRGCGTVESGSPLCNHQSGDSGLRDAAHRRIVAALDVMERPPRLLIVAPAKVGAPIAACCWPWLLRLAYEAVERSVLSVLTLQDALDEASWQDFLAQFFGEIVQHGETDRAAHTARQQIASVPNSWAPVLIARLRSARLWYEPHWMNESLGDQTWQLLISRINNGRCIPIIGPGVDYRIARFRQQIALEWADRYQYPLAHREQVNLAQVAQYIAATRGDAQMEENFIKDLRKFAIKRYGHLLNEEEEWQQPLVKLLSTLADKVALREPDDPHVVLAGIPFSVYVIANFNNFLAEALRHSGRSPQELVFTAHLPAEKIAEPSREHPMVYHLFGRLDNPDSLVLTEDNYFDFLIDFWRERGHVPVKLRRALASSSLLFLGFNLHQWDFRVLFRSLLKEQSSLLGHKQLHVAVQLDPDDDQITDPNRAREYLEAYFGGCAEKSDINIYWGSSEDFLGEMQQRWQEHKA